MISVALAAYNGEKFIEQQLQSILEQTIPPDEVIICDDCSSDRTVEICRNFIENNGLSGWSIEENKKNLGYCRNFYHAIEKTAGDIIFLCDQDDIWDCNKLEIMLGIMQSRPELMLLSSRYRLVNGEGAAAENIYVPHYVECFDGSLIPITAESLIGHSYIRGCSSCFRKELKELLAPVELSGLLGHDWQLAMLAALSAEAAVINQPLMSYRCHDGNASFSEKPKRLIEKRIDGLKQSVNGHKLILEKAADTSLKNSIRDFISFEKRRIKFLEKKNPLLWISLGVFMRQYKRYYAGNALRVWIGDLVYAMKSRSAH